ncbi:MAG: hypothetical protein AAB551_03855 [Patescibacteria group bacterium]
MRQNIAIIGATGNVGRKLIAQVARDDVPELGIHRNPTVVVALADSKHLAINPGGFPREFLERFSQTRLEVGTLGAAIAHGEEGVQSLLGRMGSLGFGKDLIYVDTTAATDVATQLHVKIIEETQSGIVTANKNPVARSSYDEYRRLTNDQRRYRYSATAMAGLGAVPWLAERHIIQDKIDEMNASLSGTLGFITDALSRGIPLSEAIKDARSKNYTEPDYRDDLNGVDVARKLVILAREAGYEVNFEDIEIDPFLPKEYLEMPDPEECLKRIRLELDEKMSDRYRVASERGTTLKYLAHFGLENGKPVLKVGLQKVEAGSAFGSLKGTSNRIEVITGMYTKEKPYRLEGPGAGTDITASVVRRDLVNMQPHVNRFS